MVLKEGYASDGDQPTPIVIRFDFSILSESEVAFISVTYALNSDDSSKTKNLQFFFLHRIFLFLSSSDQIQYTSNNVLFSKKRENVRYMQ